MICRIQCIGVEIVVILYIEPTRFLSRLYMKKGENR